jgi:hypothetical protein
MQSCLLSTADSKRPNNPSSPDCNDAETHLSLW